MCLAETNKELFASRFSCHKICYHSCWQSAFCLADINQSCVGMFALKCRWQRKGQTLCCGNVGERGGMKHAYYFRTKHLMGKHCVCNEMRRCAFLHDSLHSFYTKKGRVGNKLILRKVGEFLRKCTPCCKHAVSGHAWECIIPNRWVHEVASWPDILTC